MFVNKMVQYGILNPSHVWNNVKRVSILIKLKHLAKVAYKIVPPVYRQLIAQHAIRLSSNGLITLPTPSQI